MRGSALRVAGIDSAATEPLHLVVVPNASGAAWTRQRARAIADRASAAQLLQHDEHPDGDSSLRGVARQPRGAAPTRPRAQARGHAFGALRLPARDILPLGTEVADGLPHPGTRAARARRGGSPR